METKVFVVRYQSISDGAIVEDYVNVFADRHSAEKHFNKCVKDEQEHIINNNWKIDKSKSDAHHFCAFESSAFAFNRIFIQIDECPLENMVRLGCCEYDKDTLEEWKEMAENAVVLYDNLDEALYVEINPNYLKFFRRDVILSVYTYPPLSELKKSENFIKSIEESIDNNYMGNEREYLWQILHTWKEDISELPLFPLSMIYESNYKIYTHEKVKCRKKRW